MVYEPIRRKGRFGEEKRKVRYEKEKRKGRYAKEKRKARKIQKKKSDNCLFRIRVTEKDVDR